ncbi:cyanophycinase [Geitlerinema sp. PCC 9228]|jgi:cyanophycinase|uniref:cyanophycinase n=1 Tax=Geitlerinema sp. PCC 9228 TaxID=111611 RepID=UPI0008F9BBB9|nr:cyanophycinase [Geitlerinema sp. PCC 9228]
MMQLETNPMLADNPNSLKRTILAIGGAEDKVHGREILSTFFTRAGGRDAKIAILPSASREPQATGGRYRTIFEDMGAKSAEILDIRERDRAADPIWEEQLEEATGVFFTGGDQLRLCAILADTPIMEKIRLKVHRGEVILAGTSAGAAVMGHHMIAGGGSGESPCRSLVDMTTGLGIIPEVIVDQHFHNRNRMARLLSAIACHRDRIGIGIDEDTCAMFEGDGVLQVVGRGTVTAIDALELSHTNEPRVSASDPLSLANLCVHILTHGDRYHWRERRVVPSEISFSGD